MGTMTSPSLNGDCIAMRDADRDLLSSNPMMMMVIAQPHATTTATTTVEPAEDPPWSARDDVFIAFVGARIVVDEFSSDAEVDEAVCVIGLRFDDAEDDVVVQEADVVELVDPLVNVAAVIDASEESVETTVLFVKVAVILDVVLVPL